eukprot:scaffold107436_cov45-Prasinocladus_malaysianus.AAC.1
MNNVTAGVTIETQHRDGEPHQCFRGLGSTVLMVFMTGPTGTDIDAGMLSVAVSTVPGGALVALVTDAIEQSAKAAELRSFDTLRNVCVTVLEPVCIVPDVVDEGGSLVYNTFSPSADCQYPYRTVIGGCRYEVWYDYSVGAYEYQYGYGSVR